MRWESVCLLFTISFIDTLEGFNASLLLREKRVDYFENPKHPFFIESQQSKSPIIFVVTPTFDRPYQIPELIRMGQALSLVPRLHWVVVEDGPVSYPKIRSILHESGVWRVSYLSAVPMNTKGHRGLEQRNRALWEVVYPMMEQHLDEKAVLYFLDDDNTASLDLFVELRKIKKVGHWPVGRDGSSLYERCFVVNNTIKRIINGWVGHRRFPIDMAGFAVSKDALLGYHRANNKYPRFQPTWNRGWMENNWVALFLDNFHELEPLADNCQYILVWHTRTTMHKPSTFVEKNTIVE